MQLMNTKPKSGRKYFEQPGWTKIGNQMGYFKSKWEVEYACYLQCLQDNGSISGWKYEPQTFWFEGIKRGVCSYKPDFEVTFADGKRKWVEVKGYMDARSKTKISRFNKYFPQEILEVLDSKWFSKNRIKLDILKKMVLPKCG